jgi:two-component system, LytTR family, response regulator
MTALIVDDDKRERFSLKKLLNDNCPAVQLLEEASSVSEALPLFKKHSPQLVFLDVEMPQASGFDLLRQLDAINFKVIFVTAHSHYAIKAIKYSAVDYLLKPVHADDLVEAVKKAEQEINFNHHNHYHGLLENLVPGKTQKLAVPVKNGLEFLAPEEIIRLEADGTYTYIFSIREKFTASKNIKEYENLLVEQNFFRSHKSHLINLRHVKRFNSVEGNFVQMSDGSIAEVSRRKKEEFIELMSLR